MWCRLTTPRKKRQRSSTMPRLRLPPSQRHLHSLPSLRLCPNFVVLTVLIVPSSIRLGNRQVSTVPCLTLLKNVRRTWKYAMLSSKPRFAFSSSDYSAPRVRADLLAITWPIPLLLTLWPRLPRPRLMLLPRQRQCPRQPPPRHDAAANSPDVNFLFAGIIPTCPSSPKSVFFLLSRPVALAANFLSRLLVSMKTRR